MLKLKLHTSNMCALLYVNILQQNLQFCKKMYINGISLMVQRLKLSSLSAEGPGMILVRELDPRCHN